MTDKQYITKLEEAISFAGMAIEHAINLGHVGEGSTLGMFKEALVKCEAMLEEMGKREKHE
jgi:hypothetical protein